MYLLVCFILPFRIWCPCITSSRYITKTRLKLNLEISLRCSHRGPPRRFHSRCDVVSRIGALVVCFDCVMLVLLCTTRPVAYFCSRNRRRLDRPAMMILVPGVPDWAVCSIFTMSSMAGIAFLYPNWQLGVARCRILAILDARGFGVSFINYLS